MLVTSIPVFLKPNSLESEPSRSCFRTSLSRRPALAMRLRFLSSEPSSRYAFQDRPLMISKKNNPHAAVFAFGERDDDESHSNRSSGLVSVGVVGPFVFKLPVFPLAI